MQEAYECLTEALDHLADAADPVDKAYVFTELCYVHLARGDTDQAIAAAQNAHHLLGPTAMLEAARATTALAVALSADGQDVRAQELFTEAATVLDRLGATQARGQGLGRAGARAGQGGSARRRHDGV